jgi:hypothetical protein
MRRGKRNVVGDTFFPQGFGFPGQVGLEFCHQGRGVVVSAFKGGFELEEKIGEHTVFGILHVGKRFDDRAFLPGDLPTHHFGPGAGKRVPLLPYPLEALRNGVVFRIDLHKWRRGIEVDE